jgi:hypothetical protein
MRVPRWDRSLVGLERFKLVIAAHSHYSDSDTSPGFARLHSVLECILYADLLLQVPVRRRRTSYDRPKQLST